MADFDNDDFDFEGSDGGTLRKQLESLVKENKKLRADQEAAQRASRQSTVEAVVASRKLPDKLVNLIPSDVTDKAGVEKWLDDYADVFAPASSPSADEGKPKEEAKAPSGTNGVPAPGTALTTEQAFELFQQVISGAQPSTLPDGRSPEEALAQAAADGGTDGINKLMEELGYS